MSALRRIELSPASVPLLFPDGHTDVQETEYNSILDEFSQAQADDRTRVEREGWDYCYKCRRDNVAGVSFTTIDTETESMALRKNPGSQVITRVQSNGKLKNLAGHRTQPARDHFSRLPFDTQFTIFRVVLEDFRFVQFHCHTCTSTSGIITTNNLSWILTNRSIYLQAMYLFNTEIRLTLCVPLTSPEEINKHIRKYGDTQPNLQAVFYSRAGSHWDQQSMVGLKEFSETIRENFRWHGSCFKSWRYYGLRSGSIEHMSWKGTLDGEQIEVHMMRRANGEIIIVGSIAQAMWLREGYEQLRKTSPPPRLELVSHEED